jgi:hypothetical protein
MRGVDGDCELPPSVRDLVGPLVRAALVCLVATAGLLAAGLPLTAASAAPTWLEPVTFADPTRSFVEPRIAVDARGDAVMVWADGGIHAAYRPAGGEWQAPMLLSEQVDPHFPQPYANKVAMNARGDAVAVWSFPIPGGRATQAAVRPAGGAWQPAETISAPGSGPPKVAIDQQGDAITLWTLLDESEQNRVRASARPAGGEWQAPVEISPGGRNAYGPAVAFGPHGEATASWNLYIGGDSTAQVSSKPPGGEWQAPVDLSEAGRSAGTPKVAFDAHGDAVAVWALLFDCPGCSFNGEVIQAAYRPAGGGWQAPVDISEGGKKAEGARVAVDAQGDAVAVWERVGESGCCVIQSASRPAGGEWQAPVQLSEGEPNAGVPSLAVDPGGDAIALWTARDESEEIRVQASARPAGGEWQAPVNVSEAGRSSLEQGVAVDAHGDAVAVWRTRSAPSSYLVVQAAAYDAAGPLLDGLSIPATGAPGQALAFSVSPLDAWSALGPTSWSFGDGATATGTSASHAYAAPGSYKVTVGSEDALGNASQASGTVAIAEESKPTRPPEAGPPPRAFRILSMRIRRDGTLALRLKATAKGAFLACARMTAGRRRQPSGHRRSSGGARKPRARHRHCPKVPRRSRVFFVGLGSARAPRSGVVKLTIAPRRAALRELRRGRRLRRLFAAVTFFPPGGPPITEVEATDNRKS